MVIHTRVALAAVLLFGASMVANLSAQTTVSTPIVGFRKTTLPSGSVCIVPGFVKGPVYQSSSLISGQNFAVTGLTSGAFNESSFSDRPNYPTYYVEIVSGTYEGYTFDVQSNSASQVTVSGLPSQLNGQTVSIAIRPHYKLDDLAAGNNGLLDYSDAVNITNPDGSTTTRYFASGSWIAEDFASPAGHTVIYPGSGVVFSTGGASITTSGTVKTTKTAVPLYAAAVNYVGRMNPSGSSLVSGMNMAGILVPYTDGFNVPSFDGQMTTTSTYYSDGVETLDAGYSPLAPGATDAIPADSGVQVSVSSDTVWIMNSALTP